MAALQQTLHIQLTKQPLPEAAHSDERVALETLKDAAKELSMLLILDDVWVAKHATPLNFVDRSAQGSAVLVTTRIRALLNGASEVPCETLSAATSLEQSSCSSAPLHHWVILGQEVDSVVHFYFSFSHIYFKNKNAWIDREKSPASGARFAHCSQIAPG